MQTMGKNTTFLNCFYGILSGQLDYKLFTYCVSLLSIIILTIFFFNILVSFIFFAFHVLFILTKFLSSLLLTFHSAP